MSVGRPYCVRRSSESLEGARERERERERGDVSGSILPNNLQACAASCYNSRTLASLSWRSSISALSTLSDTISDANVEPPPPPPLPPPPSPLAPSISMAAASSAGAERSPPPPPPGTENAWEARRLARRSWKVKEVEFKFVHVHIASQARASSQTSQRRNRYVMYTIQTAF